MQPNKRIVLRMLKYYGANNAGDIAGYAPEVAIRLIRNGIAVRYQKPLSPSAHGQSPVAAEPDLQPPDSAAPTKPRGRRKGKRNAAQ